MGINVVLGSFAIIVLTTLLQSTEGDVILAGEDTPVWTAYCSHEICDNKNNLVTYKKLEKGRMQSAFSYWKSDSFTDFTFRMKRHAQSFKSSMDYDSSDIEDGQRDTKFGLKSLASIRTNTKRAADYQNGTIKAAVLVMVNYNASEVTNDASREKFINEKILYVLAYWNGINRRVLKITDIKNKPHIYLVGIIIALNRAAVPYVDFPLSGQEILKKANVYWRDLPHKDFPRNAYHAVATMTDILPTNRKVYYEVDKKNYKSSSPAIIVWDDLKFMALQRIAQTYYFQEVANNIRYLALKYPQVYDNMKLGNKLDTILPGMLMSAEQQCVARGYKKLKRICPERSESCELFCEYEKPWHSKNSPCDDTGPALDGTLCINGRILPSDDIKKALKRY